MKFSTHNAEPAQAQDDLITVATEGLRGGTVLVISGEKVRCPCMFSLHGRHIERGGMRGVRARAEAQGERESEARSRGRKAKAFTDLKLSNAFNLVFLT